MADLELVKIPETEKALFPTDLVLEWRGSCVLYKPFVGFHDGVLLTKVHSASLWGPPLPDAHSTSLRAKLLATILSNQGESSGSGGRAREGRNGGGGNGNQGIGGGVGGGGGQREGIGNERRGNRGRNHGGGDGSGDDDGNGRGGWVGYIEGERGPMGPGPHRLAETLLFLNAQMIGTLESLDIHGLPPRARIFRVVSLGFNSMALVCLSASIGHRRTSPRLACTLCWMGAFATLLGFSSMISMAFSASFIP